MKDKAGGGTVQAMFTGIIRSLGTIQAVERQRESVTLRVAGDAAAKLTSGDSIAVNGVCLTVLDHDVTNWTVRLMQETLARTALADLEPGDRVNTELPLTANQRLDGHFVQGHVDGVGTVVNIAAAGDDRIFTIAVPEALAKYVIPKGSIALDGVSLTVVDTTADICTVSLMPYTLEHTTFGRCKPGDRVNIEVDMLGKYVVQLVEQHAAARTL